MALRFCQAFAAGFCDLSVDEHGIARQNRFAKFHFICAHKITDAARGFRQFEQQNAGDLCHRFDLHDAWHYGMTGEMSLEKRFVDGDGFHTDAFGFCIETEDAVDHEEWETMRQNLHHLIGIKSTIAAWKWARHCHCASARLLARD